MMQNLVSFLFLFFNFISLILMKELFFSFLCHKFANNMNIGLLLLDILKCPHRKSTFDICHSRCNPLQSTRFPY